MNSFGNLFRVSIFGESHGIQIGVVIDGCPSGINLSDDDFKKDFEDASRNYKEEFKSTFDPLFKNTSDKAKEIFDGLFKGQKS